MLRPQSRARQLTLAAVGLLLLANPLLGADHPLTRGGWITLMAALIFNLIRSGNQTVSQAQLGVSVLFGLLMAFSCFVLGWDAWLMTMIPALFQGLLAALVARTLLPGRRPAIERIALALHPEQAPLPLHLLAYTRRSTWLWLLVFASLALWHMSTALNAPRFNEAGAIALDLLVIALVLSLEFCYRRWRYAEHAEPSLWRFVLELRRIDPLNLLLA